MKHCIVGGLAAVLMAGGLIASAPPANAGCQYGGVGIINKCDGPIQPDGTWQRCVAFATWMPSGASSYLVPDKRCNVIGPNQYPGGLAFADPPTHIDD
ncbi:MAG: hypothetical protein JO236_04675 [Mycobacterium sp.]|uniref:CDGP domain-containing protein n=1 Tax=Mycobacterium sp. TaxID=1785 RepID=UPI001EB6C8F8|nr:hypothetical protein [Mycobacterium sp.]MBW0016827.1 hypothetical protein [Mycobacterium sp.]